MMTESMRRSGWRECPSDEVRRAWEAKGGRWQCADEFLWQGHEESHCIDVEPDDSMDRGYYRPVNPKTWDVDWGGWGDITGPESKQWGEWWWWQGEGLPPQAVKARRCDDGGFRLVINGIELSLSEMGGRFIAPIPVPEVSNG